MIKTFRHRLLSIVTVVFVVAMGLFGLTIGKIRGGGYALAATNTTDATITGAVWNGDWLGFNLDGKTYSGDVSTSTLGYTNVADHVQFSSDGTTWKNKGEIFEAEYFANNYPTGTIAIGGLATGDFSETNYPYIKVLKGVLLPTEKAMTDTSDTSCYTIKEDVILKHNGDKTYSVYVAPVEVKITGAVWNDDWLGFNLDGKTYSGNVTTSTLGYTNVADHVQFSSDGSTWKNKSEFFANEYFANNYPTGTVAIGGLKTNGFSETNYPYIKVLKGVLLPTEKAITDTTDSSCYTITEDVILKHTGNKVYSVYVAPVEVKITGAVWNGDWLGFNLDGKTYSGDVSTSTLGYTNVADHVQFSSDGTTWKNKGEIFEAEYFANNYPTGTIAIGGLATGGFSETNYPYIKVLKGVLLPTEKAITDTTDSSCYTITEDVILKHNGDKTYSVYVAPVAPTVLDTTVTGVVETNYAYLGFNTSVNDYPTTETNISSYSAKFADLNFRSKIKLTYTDGTTKYLSETEVSTQYFHSLSGSGFAFKSVDNGNSLNGVKYITIEKGCQFPSYEYLTGTAANRYYQTTEEVTFGTAKAFSGDHRVWNVKKGSTTSASVVGGKYGDGWFGFTLDGVEYSAFADANGTLNEFAYTNTLANISFSKDGETWVNLSEFNGTEKFARGYYLEKGINVYVGSSFADYRFVKIKQGTIFPSNAVFDGTEISLYKTTAEVKLATVDGVEYKTFVQPISTDATVESAKYGDGWLGIKLNGVTYSGEVNTIDNVWYTNVADHIYFSEDGKTWIAKSELYANEYFANNYPDGTIGVGGLTEANGFTTAKYPFVKILSGTLLPKSGCFEKGSVDMSCYITSGEVVLHCANGTDYTVYVEPKTTTVEIKSVSILKEGSDKNGFLVIELDKSDFGSTADSVLSSAILTDTHFNFANKIKINGNALSTYSVGEILVDFYGNANTIAFRLNLNVDDWFAAIKTVVVEDGATFPSYAYAKENSAYTVADNYKTNKIYYGKAPTSCVGSKLNAFVETGSFTEVSINVGNNLDLNFYATVADLANHQIYFTATVNGQTKTYDDSSASVTINDDTVKFTYSDIAPQNIRDAVTVKMYFDGTEIDSRTYSVWDYCIKVIETSANERLVALAKDALIYGAKMQTYLNEDGEAIDVDKNGEKITSATQFDASKLDNVFNKATEEGADLTKCRFRAAGVRVDRCNAIYFRYYVKNGESASITINGENYTDKAVFYKNDGEGKIYIVYVNDVTPLKFKTTYTAKLYSGASLVETVTYSVHSFIAQKYNDAEVGEVAKALYNYGVSAQNYFYNAENVTVYDNLGYENADESKYHTIVSTGDVNLDIGTDNYITLTYNNNDSKNHVGVVGTMYYKAKSGGKTYSESFYLEAGTNEFSIFLDVYRKGATAAAIKDQEKIIVRFDFNNVDKDKNNGFFTLATVAHSDKEPFDDADSEHVLYLTNGDVTVGMDLDLGGSVTYLSKAGLKEYSVYTEKNWFGMYKNPVRYIGTDPTKCSDYISGSGAKGYTLVKSENVNLINIHDTGREIQQSYYGGVAKGEVSGTSVTNGESKNWYNAATGETLAYGAKYWSQSGAVMQYNPVQAGGAGNYESQIIDCKVTRQGNEAVSVYVKVRALEWGDNDYSNIQSWSYMENTYTFKNGMIYVYNRFVDWKGFESIYDGLDGAIGQEIPAIYVASSLGTYYAETAQYGTIKKSDFGPMTTQKYQEGITGNDYHYAIENDSKMTWHAWLNNEDVGVGIYLPSCENANVYYFAAKNKYSGKNGEESNDNTGDGSNCYDNDYCYSSCSVVSDMGEYTPLEYTYVLCVDSLTEIKSKLDNISDVDNSGLSAWTKRG